VSDDATDGWSRVLAEMDAMAEDLESEGWRTLTVHAGSAGAVGPGEGHTDTHGFSYVVPGDAAEEFRDLFVPEGFPRTEVYRATEGDRLYLLTVLQDPPTETAILLAGAVDRGSLGAAREAARETGRLFTHLLAVDGTHLGSFAHEDPDPFFPD
jgi:hypothetical protein